MPKRTGYVECHVNGDEIDSFAVVLTNDLGHPSTVIKQGTGGDEMISAALSVVRAA